MTATDGRRWRLILDGAATGAWNMALDEALAEAVDAGVSPPTLRFYRWLPPCLSLGFAQRHDAADAEYCRARGVDIVRRPTGGRAVLHHLELTYSLVARLGVEPFSHDLQAAYRLICEALVAGLRTLGVAAELAGRPEGGLIKPTEAIPCFVGPAAGEVVAGGRKLVGSAMRRLGDAILQHGSILLGWDGALQAGCLGRRDNASLRTAVVTLGELLGAVPEPERLALALADGFGTVFSVALVASLPSGAELDRASLLARERYAQERWTIDRDAALPG